MINGESDALKYCYMLYNGNKLFARDRYVYYDKLKKHYLSRDGETLRNTGPAGGLAPDEYISELTAADNQPVNELKTLFDYILSDNQCFFLFFSFIHIDNAADIADRKYYENLLEDKLICNFESEKAQEVLLHIFNNFDKKEAFNFRSLFYKDSPEVMRTIFNKYNVNNLNDIVFKVSSAKSKRLCQT